MYLIRGGSRAAARSKMEHFVIIVNGFQLLTIITKRFILDVAAALDPPLLIFHVNFIIKLLFLREDIHSAVKQESQQLQLPQKEIISHYFLIHHLLFKITAMS